MNRITLAASLAFSIFTVNTFAADAATSKSHSMGNMKMDCMKDMKGMENMKGMEGMKMDCPTKTSSKALSMAEGEVKEVDKTAKTITLKHGPIKSKTVEMGAMTMTFAVKDAGMLTKIKPNDKVRFQVENVNEQPTVVKLAPRK